MTPEQMAVYLRGFEILESRAQNLRRQKELLDLVVEQFGDECLGTPKQFAWAYDYLLKKAERDLHNHTMGADALASLAR